VGHFLGELKRRNVFRVGAAYAVVAWLIVQVIETVREPLHLPVWTETFFIVLLLAGLPLVLVFSWAFELTPEGLKKTADVDRATSVTAHTGRKLNYAIIAVLALALGYFVWERQYLVERAESVATTDVENDEVVQTAAASIAVLPFVNMSADAEQEYFSDGISEELLNLLAKIPELRVPARTSSFQFKGQMLDIAEVAKQLNVAHVLEGSVRKSGVRIRVTAQLIEADTGYHLWSDTYDRELTDIFQIQDDISAAIVDALSATLGLGTVKTPQVIAASSPEAYNAYLLGQHLLAQRTKADIEAAVTNFERALELDPDYAPAHAGLGLAWRLLLSERSSYGTLTLEEMLSESLPHIERALELDPMLPEALGTMGLILEARQAYEEAVPYYERALEINPSQTDVRNWLSSALDTLGRYDESFTAMETAYELDPLSLLTLHNYTNELVIRRQFDRAEPVLARLSQLDPSRAALFNSILLYNQNRFAESAVVIFRGTEADPGNLQLRASAAFHLLFFGLYDEALQVWPYPKTLPLVLQGSDFEQALELAQQQFEEDPDDPASFADLAWAYWRNGNRELALKNARRYLDSLGATRRPIDGTNWMFVIDAWRRGDTDTMQQHLDPIDTDLGRSAAAGIELNDQVFQQAVSAFVHGDAESARELLGVMFSRGGINPSAMNNVYKTLGWDELPAFAALRKEHEALVAEERRTFLAIACGADGFSSWQPSPDTCAGAGSI